MSEQRLSQDMQTELDSLLTKVINAHTDVAAYDKSLDYYRTTPWDFRQLDELKIVANKLETELRQKIKDL